MPVEVKKSKVLGAVAVLAARGIKRAEAWLTPEAKKAKKYLPGHEKILDRLKKLEGHYGIPSPDGKFPVGALLVVVDNPNSHSYEVGKPTLITNTSRSSHLMASGLVGNSLPSGSGERKSFRVPTLKEAKKFWRGIIGVGK